MLASGETGRWRLPSLQVLKDRWGRFRLALESRWREVEGWAAVGKAALQPDWAVARVPAHPRGFRGFRWAWWRKHARQCMSAVVKWARCSCFVGRKLSIGRRRALIKSIHTGVCWQTAPKQSAMAGLLANRRASPLVLHAASAD